MCYSTVLNACSVTVDCLFCVAVLLTAVVCCLLICCRCYSLFRCICSSSLTHAVRTEFVMCLNLLLSPHLLLCAMLTRTPTHTCTPRRSPCHLATEPRLSVKTRPTVRPYTHTYILLSIQVSIHSYTHARILSQPIYSHNHPTTHIFILVCLKHMSVGGSGRPHPDGDRSR